MDAEDLTVLQSKFIGVIAEKLGIFGNYTLEDIANAIDKLSELKRFDGGATSEEASHLVLLLNEAENRQLCLTRENLELTQKLSLAEKRQSFA